MVPKEWIQKRFALRVRIERPAPPLPSGSRTKVGELWIPRTAVCLGLRGKGRPHHRHGGATGPWRPRSIPAEVFS